MADNVSAFLEIRAQQLKRAGESLRAEIVTACTSPEFKGQNPRNIARALQQKIADPPASLFDIVFQETARAQCLAALESMRRQGVELYEISTAGDDQVCEHCREQAERSPYTIGTGVVPGFPHCTRCRCVILPVG